MERVKITGIWSTECVREGRPLMLRRPDSSLFLRCPVGDLSILKPYNYVRMFIFMDYCLSPYLLAPCCIIHSVLIALCTVSEVL